MTGSATPEVLTMGRSGVDLYPLQTGVHLEDVDTFGKFLGGSPTNVAVAVARLGHRTAVLTGVGDDAFGRFVRREIRASGVDDAHVVVVPDLPTPVTFCEIFPPDSFPLRFYRAPSAPDLQLRPRDVPIAQVRASRLLWFTASGLCAEPSRSAHLAALDAGPGGLTVLDLDYRPMFWASAEDASREVAAVLPRVDVAVGNREECEVAVGERDPERAAEALLATGVGLAVVKLGPDGVLAATHDERVFVPPMPVEVVNGLGAGDGFGGGLCHALLEGWSLRRAVEYASAAGAIVASRLECSGAMPTAAEIDLMLATGVPPARENS